MKTFLSEIIPNIQKYSQKLGNLTLKKATQAILTCVTWKYIDNTNC